MRNYTSTTARIATLMITVILITTACVTQKKLFNTGKLQMEANMYDEATETLIKALAKKKSNVEVQLTLRNCATVVFEQKTDYISDAFQNQQLEEVIRSYKNLTYLQQRIHDVGIILDIPVKATSYYQLSKESVNEQKNTDAQKALKDKNYTLAERLFREILYLDPKHNDANAGLKIAVNQPILDHAIELYENNKYRTAYRQLSQIANYKNAQDLIKLCLDKGEAKYLFVPENQNPDPFFKDLTYQLKKNNSSPFFNPIFYNEYSEVMRKYNIRFFDLFKYSDATKALYDVEKITAIVNISNFNYKIEKPIIVRNRLKGFHEQIEIIEKKDGTKEKKYSYKKVYYTVVQSKKPQTVTSATSVKMTHPKDGNTLFDKDYNLSHDDDICYIIYDDDIRKLIAGEWIVQKLSILTSKDKIYDYIHPENQFIRKYRNGKKTFRDPNQIIEQQRNTIQKEIVKNIINTTLND